MYRLPWQVMGLLFLGCISLHAQNPHDENLDMDCAGCHNEDSWSISMDTFNYNHDRHAFVLEGRHLEIDCKDCHTDLHFRGTRDRCMDCHTDMHRQSVGSDCGRCHSAASWLVDDIPQLHEQEGFPLEGSHFNIDCIACHPSDNELVFNLVGNRCVNCHLQLYEATTNPPHSAQGFPTDCKQCHDPMGAGGWKGVSHYFFPLTKGHAIEDCAACHQGKIYTGLSAECIACHQKDFDNSSFPSHPRSNFSTDCTECHTEDPGWQPVTYKAHDDLYFPIYSGKHGGEWQRCVECHTDAGDYSRFSCTDCHKHSNAAKLERKHDDVGGYSHDSRACLECHPNGR